MKLENKSLDDELFAKEMSKFVISSCAIKEEEEKWEDNLKVRDSFQTNFIQLLQ